MDELIHFYLQSTEALLRAAGIPAPIAEALTAEVGNGRPEPAAIALEKAAKAGLLSEAIAAALSMLLTRLSRVTGNVSNDSVPLDDLADAVAVMLSAAELSMQIGTRPMAYNFYEVAYHFGAIFDRPALDVAQKLRELSNPEKVDQFHSAIWRLAIEHVRDCCERRTDWLSCLDAVELALVCPVENPALQADLFSRLLQQVGKAQDTPISELALIVAVQSPRSGWDAGKRSAAMRMVAASRLGPTVDRLSPDQLEIISTAEAQIMFDDMRQLLTPTHVPSPYVTWHELMLGHQRLAGAVPLGRSLIAKSTRTELLLLDLAHEIGHAFVLQGPIGIRQAAYRAAIHYLELLILNIARERDESVELSEVPVTSVLPASAAARAAARLQVAVAFRAAIEQSVWTPWLEGVSMYVELLCDPKEDPTEISALHQCIRSLIDFNIPRNEEESDDAYSQRFADTSAAEFEEFFSNALRSRSRLNHLRYFDDAQGQRRTVSDLYCLGYLIVRSVVSAWEVTLGTRLAPAIAVKLLLNATRAGTFGTGIDVLPIDSDCTLECRIRFLAWVQSLAALPRDTLADFFTAVGRDDKGVVWIWKDGLPQRVTPASVDEATIFYEGQFDSFQRSAAHLAGLNTTCDDGSPNTHVTFLTSLFEQYVAWRRLLPIGRDMSRLLFLDAPGRVGLCTRTYIGETTKEPTSQTEPYADDPRYNHRYWTLDGGVKEAERLRRACGRVGSARLLTTRIVDFGGHPDAPFERANTSYVCSFLKSEYSRVVPWAMDDDISDTHPEFSSLLESRMFPPLRFLNEDDTIGSLSFLKDRLSNAVANDPIALIANSVDFETLALDVAMEASATAFAQGSTSQFRESYEQAMRTTAGRLAVARWMFGTGFGKPVVQEPSLSGQRLPRMIFNAQAFSGITPFGASV